MVATGGHATAITLEFLFPVFAQIETLSCAYLMALKGLIVGKWTARTVVDPVLTLPKARSVCRKVDYEGVCLKPA